MRTAFRSFSLFVALGCAAGCAREQRRFNEPAPFSALALAKSFSALTPGEPSPEGRLPRATATAVEGPYDENAAAIGDGKHLFVAFNCNGCHAQGGGGEGPALMDRRWRYGSEAGNIFASIVEGRPNGMPEFRGKLTQQQTWQLVAYLRALGGIAPLGVQPGRSDSLSGHPPEAMLKHRGPPAPRPEGVP